jgi:hypothetical protein
MTDLKLLDELLLDYMVAKKLKPADLESHSAGTITHEVITRLRSAWESGEMPEITLTWANYFRSSPAPAAAPVTAPR